MTTRDVSRHCQLFPGGVESPYTHPLKLRTTILGRRSSPRDSTEARVDGLGGQWVGWTVGELGWGLQEEVPQAWESLEGLLRAVQRHWEVLRKTVSPPGFHWFETKHKFLSTLSPGHVTRRKGNWTEGNRKARGGGSLSNYGMQTGFKAIFSIFNCWKATQRGEH